MAKASKKPSISKGSKSSKTYAASKSSGRAGKKTVASGVAKRSNSRKISSAAK